jgi:hypothetical protein
LDLGSFLFLWTEVEATDVTSSVGFLESVSGPDLQNRKTEVAFEMLGDHF